MSTLLPAAASASDICDSLVDQLASTTEVYGSSEQSRKYDSAIKAQSDQIRTAKYDMKRLGCSQGSVIVYGGANSVMCEKLATTLERMQSNLEQLSVTKATLPNGFGDNAGREQLLQSYREHNCSTDVSEAEATVQTISAEPNDQPMMSSEPTLEVATAEPQPEESATPDILNEQPVKQSMIVVPLGNASEGGALKTLCVRTCDGGFFPISQGASPSDFRRDARVCSMMCPGTETELFYNSNASDKPEEMVSIASGKTYSDLPRAFAYRTNPGSGGAKCGCNFSAYYKEMMRREAELTKQEKPKNAAANQSVASINMRTELLSSPKSRNETSSIAPGNRKIRQVGPAFLQDESAAIDLKHPNKNIR